MYGKSSLLWLLIDYTIFLSNFPVFPCETVGRRRCCITAFFLCSLSILTIQKKKFGQNRAFNFKSTNCTGLVLSEFVRNESNFLFWNLIKLWLVEFSPFFLRVLPLTMFFLTKSPIDIWNSKIKNTTTLTSWKFLYRLLNFYISIKVDKLSINSVWSGCILSWGYIHTIGICREKTLNSSI